MTRQRSTQNTQYPMIPQSEGGAALNLSAPIGEVMLAGVERGQNWAGYGKVYTRRPDGSIKSTTDKFHSSHIFEVTEIESLWDLRDRLRSVLYDRQKGLILFSEPTEETLRANARGIGVRRKVKADDPQNPPTLNLAPSSIFMVDIDELPIPEGADYDQVAEEAPRHLLPPCLSDVSFVLQMSASAKLKNPDQLKAHYFFAIVDERGVPKRVHKDWLKALFEATAPKRANPPTNTKSKRWWYDQAPFSGGQLLFTCAPQVQDGLVDPYTAEERVRVVEGLHPALVITPELERIVEEYLSRGQKKRRVSAESPKQSGTPTPKRIRDRRKRLAPSSLSQLFSELYPKVAEPPHRFYQLLDDLTRECLEVEAGRYDIIKSYALRGARLISSYEVGFTEAWERFVDRAFALRPKDRRELERLVRWAFEAVLLEDLERDEEGQTEKLDHIPSTHAEIQESSAEVMMRAFRAVLNDPRLVGCVRLPTGAGKTYKALELALEAAQKRPDIYDLSTRSLADQKYQEAIKIYRRRVDEGLDRFTPINRRRSRAEKCERMTEGIDRDQVKRLYEVLELPLNTKEGSLCAQVSCPRSGSCPAQRAYGRGLENELYITTHAMVNSLSQDLLTEDTLIIYDENPKTFFVDQMDISGLEQIKWLTSAHPELAMIAHTVNALIHAQRAKTFALDELLQSAPDLDFARALARTLLDHPEFSFPVPTHEDKARILAGGDPGLTPQHRRIMKALCRGLVGESTGLEVITRDHTDVIRRTIEVRNTWKPKAIGDRPISTLILDATPSPEISAISESLNRSYQLFTAREGSIRGELNEAYYRKVTSLDPFNIFGVGAHIRSGNEPRIDAIARDLREKLEHFPDQTKVAVLTSKKFKRALQSGHEREVQANADRLSITELLDRFEVTYGHYHADTRGSNAFEECEVLILLGSSKFELATAQAQHRALKRMGATVDFSAYYEGINQDEVDQALGRGRTLRRSITTLYYGSVDPREYPDDGMIWRRLELKGRPLNRTTQQAREYALKYALLGAHVSAKRLLSFGLNLRTAQKVIAQLEEHERLMLLHEGHDKVITLKPEYHGEVRERLRALAPSATRSLDLDADVSAYADELIDPQELQASADSVIESLLDRVQDEEVIFVTDELEELKLSDAWIEEIEEGIARTSEELDAKFSLFKHQERLIIHKGRSKRAFEGYSYALLALLCEWRADVLRAPPHVQVRRDSICAKLMTPMLEKVICRYRGDFERS